MAALAVRGAAAGRAYGSEQFRLRGCSTRCRCACLKSASAGERILCGIPILQPVCPGSAALVFSCVEQEADKPVVAYSRGFRGFKVLISSKPNFHRKPEACPGVHVRKRGWMRTS